MRNSLNDVLMRARHMKETLVAQHPDDDELSTISTMVIGWKGDRQVMIGHFGGVDPRLVAVGASRLMFGMLGVDEVVFFSEAYSRVAESEDDRSLRRGEMQDAWAEGQRDGLCEIFITISCWLESDGPSIEQCQLPFVREGATVQFGDEVIPQRVEGYMVEALLAGATYAGAFDSLERDEEFLALCKGNEIDHSGMNRDRVLELASCAQLSIMFNAAGPAATAAVPVHNESEEKFLGTIVELSTGDLSMASATQWWTELKEYV